jgi:hypothetical protein
MTFRKIFSPSTLVLKQFKKTKKVKVKVKQSGYLGVAQRVPGI